MIIQENFEKCKVESLVWLKCDYCGIEFQRIKSSIKKCNKIVKKDSCGAKSCTQTKREEAFLITHGSKDLFTSQKFKKKQIQTNMEKYGTEEYFSSKDFQNKRKKALIERYGVESPLQSKEINEKQRQTCLEKYGVENYSNAADFSKKMKAANLKKFGFESPMQNPEFLKKREETCLKKYGKTNAMQNNKVREKYTKTCLDKYGCICPSRKMLGKTQNEIKEWLNSLGHNFNSNYSILGSKEIDLYDENINLAIEYCGLYWHNELSPSPRLRLYHYDKYKKCLDKNIRLLTIFEDEWKLKENQCKNILKSIINKCENKIFARKCIIEQYNKKEFNLFCENEHLLGANQLGILFYVLKYNSEIVAGMSLGRHPRNSKVLALDRLCFKSDYQVIGGSSKLFKYCKQWAKNNNYNKIISWSDNRWSQGNVYSKLGFVLEDNIMPDYSYVNITKPYYRISKQSQKKKNTGCPNDKTEKEWALINNLARIWDCGKKRWIINI